MKITSSTCSSRKVQGNEDHAVKDGDFDFTESISGKISSIDQQVVVFDNSRNVNHSQKTTSFDQDESLSSFDLHLSLTLIGLPMKVILNQTPRVLLLVHVRKI